MQPQPETSALPRLVGTAEITKSLGVSRRSLDRLVARGDFPKPDYRIGGLLKWKAETVEGALEMLVCSEPRRRGW